MAPIRKNLNGQGRPSKGAKANTITVSCGISEDLAVRLENVREASGLPTRSEFIRTAITEHVRRLEQDLFPQQDWVLGLTENGD